LFIIAAWVVFRKLARFCENILQATDAGGAPSDVAIPTTRQTGMLGGSPSHSESLQIFLSCSDLPDHGADWIFLESKNVAEGI
jgi:hypothetical protein